MAPKLIAEDGQLKGKIYSLEGQDEYILGRDPDLANVILEDPSVSRKHLLIREKGSKFFAKNLSLINPTLLDGKPMKEEVELQPGQMLQIGSTHFRYVTQFDETFTFQDDELDTMFEEKHDLPTSFEFSMPPSRYMLKVLSGPNSGAEFFMQKGRVYIIGKDSSSCDIVFYDRSVSKEHVSILIQDDNTILVKDLNSRNGVFVSGINVDEETITFQDVIAIGTTTFVIIDTEQEQPTIVSRAPQAPAVKPQEKAAKSWKKIFVPTRDLIVASVFTVIVLFIGISMLMLFKRPSVDIVKVDHSSKIKSTLKEYSSVEFTFNEGSGQLFLVGNIGTGVEKEQMLFEINALGFIRHIEDNVVTDELVWKEMNSIFSKNKEWQSINMYSPKPGLFVVSGYMNTPQEIVQLQDFINLNFNYADKLRMQVYSEEVLKMEIQKILTQGGFVNVESTFADGDATLQGSINIKNEKDFKNLITALKKLDGIRNVKDLVVVQRQLTDDAINLGTQFIVTGTSKKDQKNVNVVINGKIYFLGDNLDGMTITTILQDEVLLEKDGLKYKILYNL